MDGSSAPSDQLSSAQEKGDAQKGKAKPTDPNSFQFVIQSKKLPYGHNRHDSLRETFTPEKISELKTRDGGTMDVPIVMGDVSILPDFIQHYVAEYYTLCEPKALYLCDGSEEEGIEITEKLVERGTLIKLKYENSYLCRTDPADVARVESKTFMVTPKKHDSVPRSKDGVKCTLGNWMSPENMQRELDERFPGCMKGRVMYVVPFSMGPIDSPLAKIGVELTDSNYVVLSMRIMTRVSNKIWDMLRENPEYVKCIHSIGAPRPITRPLVNHWPCNPERVIVAHFPEEKRIMSYGSGYGGNSLLGKKCFALRLASCIARDEGWLAEHMLVMGITNPEGVERFIAAAFPSGCGKTNLSMMTPTLPGWRIRCLGDDIAWMRFDKDGRLRAINPEAGFFGIAPGTNRKTNPVAMDTFNKNSIFTNVALTEDGGVYWEGMEKEVDQSMELDTWMGEKWHIGDPGKAAHPNSRFCCPINQCPIIHPDWESPEGVPIDAIVLGGRRPVGMPLVLQARDWEHGVMLGAALKSEATAAAEHTGRRIMHDPMAMRPFFGYNFGQYLEHWLSLNKPGRKIPPFFHVNWFRLDKITRKFMWPGFGENIRVMEWIIRRINGEDVGEESPIGIIPKKGSLNLEGLKNIDWDQLFSLPVNYCKEDIRETIKFLQDQVGEDLPEVIANELQKQKELYDTM